MNYLKFSSSPFKGVMASGLLMAGTALPACAATALIDNSTRNGSFELANGVQATGKISNWDAANNIDNWTIWASVSTASNDSGTDAVAGRATNGTRHGFMQAGNAVYNMTSYAAQVGDVFEYSFKLIDRGSANPYSITLDLVYDNAGTITQFNNGTALVQTSVDPGATNTFTLYSASYTVQAGDAIVGQTVGLGFLDAVNFPNFDEVVLQVTPIPEPSAALLGGLGILCLFRRRRN